MSNPMYDSEEYIRKVMSIERCSREEACKLIAEFKEIDKLCNIRSHGKKGVIHGNTRKEG